MNDLIAGALIAGYLVAALFFLRFWSASRDRLFVLFAAAFLLLAIQRVALAVTHDTLEHQTPFYAVRLAAYVLILVAIVEKNRR